MKGDFSRRTFDPRKHYAGVLMQQGRVQTDADWNEEGEIQRGRVRIEARDLIGPCGAPTDDAGFAITVAGRSMTIGAGRYYVDGLLCVNETDALAYEAQPDLPGAPDWLDALTRAKAAFGIAYLDVWERHITPLEDPLLREVALGGPDTATRIKTVWQVRVLPLVSCGEVAAAGSTALPAPSCHGSFKEWDDLVADPGGTLNARTTPPVPAMGPSVLPPAGGYRGAGNQLYRVEVHRPGPPGTATFKWSRDNGSVVAAIEKISGRDVTVHDPGPDGVLRFANGQWVEIGDDRSELAGRSGQLVQIDSVDPSLRRITLKTAPVPLAGGPDGVDKALHPRLRRWDQSGAAAGVEGVATSDSVLPLEDGLEVQFGGGGFATGDYWLIPARTATAEIEWPPFAVPNTSPEAQARCGIHHRYARLALLAFDAATETWGVAEDGRRLFPPLTGPGASKSMHVAGTNWKNDDAFPLASVAREGLRIRLDTAPDPASLTNDTVEVALELPAAEGQARSWTLFQSRILHGDVGRDATDAHVVVWRPAADLLRSTLADVPAVRVRVRLKGHVIWNDAKGAAGARRFLDGQAFGQPGLRADRKTPRIDLAFPSGRGAAASDFESWFLLRS